MRARLALRYSDIQVELREIDLKHKPEAMLLASPKATVPVLILPDQTVIDESLDIIHWALQQNDPQHWLQSHTRSESQQLIDENDQSFKRHLDHYKYADRFPAQSPDFYRQQGEAFLQKLELRLQTQTCLFANTLSVADIALLPFIRQFAYVDISWFQHSRYLKLNEWLLKNLQSELFLSIMHKHPIWKNTGQLPVIF